MLARYMLSSCVCPTVCLSVCPSSCPSETRLYCTKRLNIGSRKQCHTIDRVSSFLMPKISAKLSGQLTKEVRLKLIFKGSCSNRVFDSCSDFIPHLAWTASERCLLADVMSCAVCRFSENVPRARKELSNLSRYTSARRKLCCLRRVVNCLVTHNSGQHGTGQYWPLIVWHITRNWRIWIWIKLNWNCAPFIILLLCVYLSVCICTKYVLDAFLHVHLI